MLLFADAEGKNFEKEKEFPDSESYLKMLFA